jgi:hypothetical protein
MQHQASIGVGFVSDGGDFLRLKCGQKAVELTQARALAAGRNGAGPRAAESNAAAKNAMACGENL